jgi:ribosomal RNA small subunit methyltransferase A
VEIGPGPGSLTRVLLQKYPKMTAIEIDQRAVKFLNEKLHSLNVIHQDVLTVDWPNIAKERDGPVNIIANLPYHIVSQVLFTLADSHKAINKAIVTTQYEVAERIVAKPSTKEYGILSVVFQLYATPKMNFKIPPTVFYPQPKVDSALVTIDFTKPHQGIYSVDPLYLKKVIHTAFRQRRKMLRASLREVINADGLTLPEKWAQLRPEQLHPAQFIELTNDLYQNSKVSYSKRADLVTASDATPYTSEKPHIWRESKQKGEKQTENMT